MTDSNRLTVCGLEAVRKNLFLFLLFLCFFFRQFLKQEVDVDVEQVVGSLSRDQRAATTPAVLENFKTKSTIFNNTDTNNVSTVDHSTPIESNLFLI